MGTGKVVCGYTKEYRGCELSNVAGVHKGVASKHEQENHKAFGRVGSRSFCADTSVHMQFWCNGHTGQPHTNLLDVGLACRVRFCRYLQHEQTMKIVCSTDVQ